MDRWYISHFSGVKIWYFIIYNYSFWHQWKYSWTGHQTNIIHFCLNANQYMVMNIHLFLFVVDCDRTTENLPSLGPSIRCAVSGSCSDIRCCVHSGVLGENLEAYVDLDICNGKVSIGIEKYHWTDKLLGYKFGDVRHVSLLGMVNLEYVIRTIQVIWIKQYY